MRLGWAELRDFRNHALTRVEELPDGILAAVARTHRDVTNYRATLERIQALATAALG